MRKSLVPRLFRRKEWDGKDRKTESLAASASNSSRVHENEEQTVDLKSNKFGLSLLRHLPSPSAIHTDSYNVDIIAVHGLGGHAYETWTHPNGKLWLRDLLPPHLPGARIFTYGYNSAFVFSRETGALRDYARALLEDIRNVRTTAEVLGSLRLGRCSDLGSLVS